MAVFKCKMCGGALEIQPNATVVTCDYCGTQQTLPKLDDERRVNLYDRANHFRRNNDFDKAMGIYEQILNEDQTDAEAYWSLVLCKYGIVYVQDPATRKQVPTVNRAQFTSVIADENYKSALQYADELQRTLYQQEAKYIDEVQKGILAISQNEKPFDVFICYKETDNFGRRTHDSVLAQDLYYQLTQEGFNVFFSRITLEDKLGTAYEPYIFAALNSAKVMVVLGTKPEHFKAVWVKNEWSRYLALVKNSKGKKVLIPAYKDMDPYDLPEEFSHLQAQDMSKLGFMQDLIRGVKKIASQDTTAPTTVREAVVVGGVSADVGPLLRRAFIYLEDKDWGKANEYFERVLDMLPECAEAYLGKLMADLHVSKQSDLQDIPQPFDDNPHYPKVIRYGDQKLVDEVTGYINHINERNEQQRLEEERQREQQRLEEERQRLEGLYQKGKSLMANGHSNNYYQAAEIFGGIKHYKDSSFWAERCIELAKEAVYNESVALMKNATTREEYLEAQRGFLRIATYKDANALSVKCVKLAVEAEKSATYNDAVKRQSSSRIGDVKYAITQFRLILGYKDSRQRLKQCEKKLKKLEREEYFQLNKKRIITTVCIIIAILLVACLIAGLAILNDDPVFIYFLKLDGTYTVRGIKDESIENITIPAEHKGIPITKVGKRAFEDCTGLTSITIPESVTSIGEFAFTNCTNLSEVHISNIASWCNIDFCNIYANPLVHAKHLYLSGEEIINLVIPEGVTSIGNYAFTDCSSVTSVTLPSSLTSIGENAFTSCEGLTSIALPGNLTSIGSRAFVSCERLTNITIPSSVTNIGKGAFRYCYSLKRVTFEDRYNWKTTSTEGKITMSIDLDLSDPSYNAYLLVDSDKYWYNTDKYFNSN